MEIQKAIRYGAILLLAAGLNQACEAQSKEETLQWIKSRLPETTATSHYDDNTVSVSYSNVVINGCLLTYTQKLSNVEADIFSGGDKSTAKRVTEVTIPLNKLSSARFRSATDAPSDGLLVTSAVVFESADKVITTKWTSSNQDYSEPVRTAQGSNGQSKYSIWVSDKAVAQRLVKAFSHAIELCGGKKETF